MPIQSGEESQFSLDSTVNMRETAAERLNTSRAVNAASEIIAPSFSSQPLSVTHTSKVPTLRDMVDMDGDGDIDLLGTSAGGELFWWENDGNYGFSEHIIATEHSSTFAEGFDVDGDGDIDIVTYVPYDCDEPCTNPEPSELFWWENYGSQNFTKSLIHKVTLKGTQYSPILVDLDKDGDGDLIIGESDDDLAWLEYAESGWDYYCINNKKGIEDIVAGDFDGDNDLDIGAAYDYSHPSSGSNSDALMIWKNDGSKGFTSSVVIDNEAKYDGNRDLKAVDFDNDEDLDLLSTNGDVEWWENLGDLQFIRHEISANSTYSVYPGDLEGDGDVDVFYTQGPWMLMENLGTGEFQRRSIALADPEKSIFGDLDKDGSSDLVAYGSGADEYFDWLEYVAVNPAALFFYDGFEDRTLGNSWENLLSDDGEVHLQSDTVISGTQSLSFTEPAAEIRLSLDLAGMEDVELSFVLGTELEQETEDGIYISEDGINWHMVISRTITSTTQVNQVLIDLDEARDLNGLTYNENFQIKFSLNGGGFWLDEVKVSAPGFSELDPIGYVYLPIVVRLEEIQ